MTSAIILINCVFPFVQDVMSELKKISEVVDAYRVEGLYHIIAKVTSKTEEELHEVIKNQIGKIDKITTTVTLIISKHQ
jgi:DNA-binding Lrp family transcriptional regulator